MSLEHVYPGQGPESSSDFYSYGASWLTQILKSCVDKQSAVRQGNSCRKLFSMDLYMSFTNIMEAMDVWKCARFVAWYPANERSRLESTGAYGSSDAGI